MTKSAPEIDPLIDQLVGDRYRVIERVAAGGMGIVYRAEQIPLGRSVAVKVLKAPSSEAAERFRKRFLREAETLAKLNHPNTIVVHDYGEFHGDVYMAMEFLDGRTLSRELIENGPMDPFAAVHVAYQIAASLSDAHAQGLVHRDLKPGNVMLTARGGDPNFVKVLDFGLVKDVTGEGDGTGLTQSGVMLGSPRYMSPEQVRGTEIDHRADIYSFGILLFTCLVGKPPFGGKSKFDVMRAHVYNDPPPLKEMWAGCTADAELEAVIMRCLKKESEERYQTMEDVIQELVLWRHRHGSASESTSNWAGSPVSRSISLQGPAPVDKRRWFIISALASAAIVSAVMIYLANRSPKVETKVQTKVVQVPAPADKKQAKKVTVESSPPGAKVSHDGNDLGDTPVNVEVYVGEPLTISLNLSGYRERKIVVNGASPTVSVELQKRRRKKKKTVTPPEEKKTVPPVEQPKKSGHSDIKDPDWGS